MEIQENDVMEGLESFAAPSISSTSSAKNLTKVNSDKIDYLNNPFYDLIEKQANEFGEFGKRMSLDLKNSYKEYLVQQKKVKTDSIETEKVYKEFEEKIVSQLQLIDSLKARIEELETDYIIKDQDIKKLQHEFSAFKKEVQSILNIPAQDSKKSLSLTTDENDKNLEIIEKLNIEPYTDSCDEVIEYNEKERDLFISDYNKIYYEESSTSYQPYNELPLYEDHETSDDYELTEHPTSYDEPSTPYQQYNKSYYDKELTEPSTTYQRYSHITQYYNQPFSTNEQQKVYLSQATTSTTSTSNYYNASTPNYNTTTSNYNATTSNYNEGIRKIHAKVGEILKKSKRVQDHTFKCLRDYNINQLLKYETSDLFKSLSIRTKSCIKISINDELRDELSGKKNITQPLNLYIERQLVPSLPLNIKSYTEFQKTHQYSILSKEKKKRIQGLISMEKKNKKK